MSAAPLRAVVPAAFAVFLSFFLLLSVLPLYARALGVADGAIGVVMGAFALSAMVLRPWAGWAADRYGRRPLMLAGSLLFVLASPAYALAAGAAGLTAVRLLHGAGMGLFPTAASAVQTAAAMTCPGCLRTRSGLRWSATTMWRTSPRSWIGNWMRSAAISRSSHRSGTTRPSQG